MTETTPNPGPKRPRQKMKTTGARAATPAKNRNRIAGVALLIALLASALGGYAWWQSADNARAGAKIRAVAQQDVDSVVAWIETQLEQVEDDSADGLDTLRDELQTLQQRQDETHDQAEAQLRQIRTLTTAVNRVRFELSRDARRWRLAEVEHLLVLANQRLRLSADAGLAIRALRLADEILIEIDNPNLAPVRKLLVGEIAALGGVAAVAVDVAGTLDALSTLAAVAEELPLAGDILEVGGSPTSPAAPADDEAESDASTGTSTSAPAPTETESAGWHWIKTIFTDLGGLVQVKSDGAPPPILSGELRRMIYAKTDLLLESAQLAFLREQRDVYAERMARAEHWVTENFAADSPEVSAWLAQLAALAVVSPRPELPDVSASLAALRAAIQTHESGD